MATIQGPSAVVPDSTEDMILYAASTSISVGDLVRVYSTVTYPTTASPSGTSGWNTCAKVAAGTAAKAYTIFGVALTASVAIGDQVNVRLRGVVAASVDELTTEIIAGATTVPSSPLIAAAGIAGGNGTSMCHADDLAATDTGIALQRKIIGFALEGAGVAGTEDVQTSTDANIRVLFDGVNGFGVKVDLIHAT